MLEIMVVGYSGRTTTTFLVVFIFFTLGQRHYMMVGLYVPDNLCVLIGSYTLVCLYVPVGFYMLIDFYKPVSHFPFPKLSSLIWPFMNQSIRFISTFVPNSRVQRIFTLNDES